MLDDLYESFNVADGAEDPVQFLAGYPALADREIVAFIAGALAFGRVSHVKASIARVLDLIGPSPAAYVHGFDARVHGPAFASFVHRWTRGADVVALLLTLQHMLRESGSIEGFYRALQTGGALPTDALQAAEVLDWCDAIAAIAPSAPPIQAPLPPPGPARTGSGVRTMILGRRTGRLPESSTRSGAACSTCEAKLVTK